MLKIYEVNESSNLHLDKDHASIIKIKAGANLNLKISAKQDILMIFENKEDLKTNQNIELLEGSEVLFHFLSLDDNHLIQDTNFHLQKNTSLNIKSNYLVSKDKTVAIKVYHHDKRSLADMDNSAIIKDGAKANFKAFGHIDNGASGSKHHQKTRCLTIDDVNRSQIEPILQIYENDVEASHAMSLGTVDEDVMYYLNTRGLNYSQALALICESYLSNDYSFLKDENAIKEVEELTREKVNNL